MPLFRWKMGRKIPEWLEPKFFIKRATPLNWAIISRYNFLINKQLESREYGQVRSIPGGCVRPKQTQECPLWTGEPAKFSQFPKTNSPSSAHQKQESQNFNYLWINFNLNSYFFAIQNSINNNWISSDQDRAEFVFPQFQTNPFESI